MNTAAGSVSEEILVSVFRIGTILLRYRVRIILLALAGAVIAAGLTLAKKRVYTASASFVPQGASDASGLRNLAGQFGLSVPATTGAPTPDFYVALVTSPLILAPIAADSFATGESGTTPKPFATLAQIETSAPDLRAEIATETLKDLVWSELDKKTGVISVRATTRWRPTSLAIVSRILQGVNDFNLHTRQSQAAAERRFAEQRMLLAQEDLRGVEDKLQRFLEGNREIGAPRVRFEVDRLQREVAVRQQVVLTFAQAIDDARLREVRDTPVITVIQNATAPIRPDSRGGAKRTLLGLLAGGMLGVLLAIFSEVTRGARRTGRPEAESFFREVWNTFHHLRWVWPFRARKKS